MRKAVPVRIHPLLLKPRRSFLFYTFAVISLGLLFLFSGAGCSPTAGEVQKTALVVELTSIEQREIYETIRLSGQISAHREVSVLVEIPARVEEVMVKLGDTVQAGDLLIRLESKDLEVQLLQAEAGLAAAQAQYGEARAGARPQDLVQARAGLRQAESGYAVAARQRERMEALYEEGIVSLQELEMARSQYENAAAGLETARALLQKMEEGPTPYTLQLLQAQVTQAEAALSAARRHFDKAFLHTPISGKVAAVMLHKGEPAGGGMPAVIVVDDDPVYLDIFVDETQIGYLAAGDEVQVEIPAAVLTETSNPLQRGSTGNFAGRIRELSPAALAGSRSFQVRVELANSKGLIKHGMFARVLLRTRYWEAANVVPAAAVQQRDGRDYIFFYDQGYARAVNVTTGEQLDGVVQVFGELPALPLIARAPRSLNDGDAVEAPQ